MAKYAVEIREGGGQAAQWGKLIPGAELFAIDSMWKLVETVGPLHPLEPGRGCAQHAVVTEAERNASELSDQEWDDLPKFDFHTIEQMPGLDFPRHDWRSYRAPSGAVQVYYDVPDLRFARLADVPLDVQRTSRRIEAIERGTGRALVIKDTEGSQGQILDKSTEPQESR